MQKSQSEFLRLQPFLKNLRTTTNNLTKHNRNTTEYLQNNSPIAVKENKSKGKSLTKCQTLTFQSKSSINRRRENGAQRWFYYNHQIDILLGKSCTKNESNSQLQGQNRISQTSDSFSINKLQILILFTKQETENLSKGSQNKVQMTITPYEISIQDESRVKRSFPTNLTQKIDQMKWLRIHVSQQYKPESVMLNGKLLACQFNKQNDLHNNEKICVLNPWELINQQKTLLQNKILSAERPKSKIKWSLSSNQNDETKDSSISSNMNKKKVESKHNYVLHTPKGSFQKATIQFKCRTNQINNSNKKEKILTDVFQTPVKLNFQTFSSISALGTFTSPKHSQQKPKYALLTEHTPTKSLFSTEQLKRTNNIIQNLKVKEQNKFNNNKIDENQSQILRPKSSFKNLKQKNEYFQMRQSQRKKSLKKIAQYEDLEQMIRSQLLTSSKSTNQIKSEFGL